MSKKVLVEGLGWYGVAAILVAYGGISFDYFTSASVTYQLLNVSGAIGIGVDAYIARNYQPVVLNLVWLLVALTALGRIFF